MKFTTCVSLLVSALVIMALPSSAQVLIDWGSVVGLSNDSDVKTNGTLFDAANSWMNGGYTASTVNGITFNALSNYVGGTNGQDGTDSIITWHSDGGDYNAGFTGGSAAYQNVISHSSDANNGTVTIGNALHPLTTGQEYQVQAFDYWPGPYAAELNGNPSVSFPNYTGGYSIGTFVASGPSETFTYGGISNNAGHAGFLNDVVVEALPEPGTWAMLLGGLGMLTVLARVRRVVSL